MLRLTVPDIRDEDIDAVVAVLRSGMLVQGEKVRAFEQGLADVTGVEPNRVVAVNSGTSALYLSLLALGIGPGDAVFLPAFTFIATANVVELLGARPVFVDVSSDDYNILPELLERRVAEFSGLEKPKAVIAVHEFGCPAEMHEICEIAARYGMLVVEDAACALGATIGGRSVGTYGRAGCFSFHPRKSITTGEGGAIVTQDVALADRLRLLRNHGMKRTDQGFEFETAGFNLRMTELQAALGIGQLRRIDENIAERRKHVRTYQQALEGMSGIILPSDIQGHSWQSFMFLLPADTSRSDIIAQMRTAGIEANVGAQAVQRTEFYAKKYPDAYVTCPTATRCADRGLVLPLYFGLETAECVSVVECLRAILSKKE